MFFLYVHRKFYREQLEGSDEDQAYPLVSCDDMSDSEKNPFIQYLICESRKKDQQNHHLQQTIDALSCQLSVVQLTLDRIGNKQHSTRDEKFVGMSRKSVTLRDEHGRDDDKGDWDGTSTGNDDDTVCTSDEESVPNSDMVDSDSASTSPDIGNAVSDQASLKASRSFRQGMKYLPYMLETPVYRDMIRLFELKFWVSRQTILNWLSKGASALKKLHPVLKAHAFEKDSIVNCDETWCRVKMADMHKKAYIWCMVNKAAGIVIFFYDEGSCGRKVLTDFIGDAELAAWQSDAYNVYKYLDDELSEVEHVCCMAHVRARFPKDLLQGKSEQAGPFMKWIGRLYDLERVYLNEGLSPDEIKRCRNGSDTTEIIASIWMELTRLLDDPLPKSDLLNNALNYLKHAWTSVMAYRHDGRYCIDNSIAERSLRALTVERKNKMAFGSHKGAETSSVYHTFTATCRMGTLSFYQFLKNFFTAFMEGRTDFENLPPAILGKIN